MTTVGSHDESLIRTCTQTTCHSDDVTEGARTWKWLEISQPVQITSLFMIEVIVLGSSTMSEGLMTHDRF
jgi:predicted CxxxxCH...CXXCH cytochrome family protein